VRVRDFIIRPGATWDATRRDLDLFVRDVAAVLNGGIKLRDQMRIVRDVSFDAAHLPVDVGVPATSGVLGVVLVGARRASDGHTLSGGEVEWSAPHPGVIRVHALSALPASGRYDATFAMVE
jgi:hypothetical protein